MLDENIYKLKKNTHIHTEKNYGTDLDVPNT